MSPNTSHFLCIHTTGSVHGLVHSCGPRDQDTGGIGAAATAYFDLPGMVDRTVLLEEWTKGSYLCACCALITKISLKPQTVWGITWQSRVAAFPKGSILLSYAKSHVLGASCLITSYNIPACCSRIQSFILADTLWLFFFVLFCSLMLLMNSSPKFLFYCIICAMRYWTSVY